MPIMDNILNKILVVDDEQSIRWVLKTSLQKKGYNVKIAEDGNSALKIISKENFAVILLDLNLPDLSGFELLRKINESSLKSSVIIITAQNSVKNAIEAMKLGAYDYFSKPFDIEQVNYLVSKAIENYKNTIDLEKLSETVGVKTDISSFGIVGTSQAMTQIYKIIGKIADKDITVLITGESGSGKELIARAIHYNSSRNKSNLVSVNIAAIPSELLESELFGYEKGAFTGATLRKIGRFEEANNGTLHLDEIGDMSADLQTKLLRVLEEKKLYRLGSERPIDVDVRILVSTNRNLDDEVEKGNFRKDLYYRLNAITIEVPPLRQRKDDILILTDYFQHKYSEELKVDKKVLSEQAENIILDYDWPGNVRELENTIKSVLVLSADKIITPDNLIEAAPNLMKARLNDEDSFDSILSRQISKFLDSFDGKLPTGIYDNILRKVEKPLIYEILKATKGNKKKAATVLGINRNTLAKKISDLNIILEE
jgi:two-component system nitrogen regulation response regulator GlnG